MDRIYYYKTSDGMWHFSTGVKKDDAKAGEYIRMLRRIRKDVERLYLDIPQDFRKIKKVFGIPDGIQWQNIYSPLNN